MPPAKDWIYIDVPPLIPEEIFEAVQDILRSQDFPQKKIAKKTVHLFAGFVFCQCGSKMYVPNKGISYICAACRNKVGKDDLELVFNSQLKDFFYSPEKLAELAQREDRRERERFGRLVRHDRCIHRARELRVLRRDLLLAI